MDNIKIDWKKYVDKIYCIRYIGESEYRIKKCTEEFKRVDILDSGIYYEFVNINSPFYKEIYETLFSKFAIKRPYDYVTDCTFGHYYCMKHAEYYGYERILILESDCVFLRDKNQIIDILERYNEIISEDKDSLFILNACEEDYPAYTFILNYNFNNIFYKENALWCAGFNIYSKAAYKVFTKKYENHEFFTNDTYKLIYDGLINVYYNETNICIQQDWVKMTVNFEILYNIDFNVDYIERFKNDKLELLSSWIVNFSNLQKSNNYDLTNLKNTNNVFYNYYTQLFELLNRSFFDNKLNINDYIITHDNT